MKISFCTVVLDDWDSLNKVFDKNLRDLGGTEHEWIILDMGSTDIPADGIPDSPNLKYVRVARPAQYDLGKFLNQALQLSQSDFKMVMGANQLIHTELVNWIEENSPVAFRNIGQGSLDRIGATAEVWTSMRGFPEGLTDKILFKEMEQRLRCFYPYLVDSCDIVGNLIVPSRARDPDMPKVLGWVKEVSAQTFVPDLEVNLPQDLEVGLRYTREYPDRFGGTFDYNFQFVGEFDFSCPVVLPGIGSGTPPVDGSGKLLGGWSLRVQVRNGEAGAYLYSMQRAVKDQGDWYPLVKVDDGKVHTVRISSKDSAVVLSIDGTGKTLNLTRGPTCSLYHVYRGDHPDASPATPGIVQISHFELPSSS
jgi:hypothetical protein